MSLPAQRSQIGPYRLDVLLVDGPDLAELLRDGPLEVGLAVDYGCQVAAGLEAAHGAGVVHRDLKTGSGVEDGDVVAAVGKERRGVSAGDRDRRVARAQGTSPDPLEAEGLRRLEAARGAVEGGAAELRPVLPDGGRGDEREDGEPWDPERGFASGEGLAHSPESTGKWTRSASPSRTPVPVVEHGDRICYSASSNTRSKLASASGRDLKRYGLEGESADTITAYAIRFLDETESLISKRADEHEAFMEILREARSRVDRETFREAVDARDVDFLAQTTGHRPALVKRLMRVWETSPYDARMVVNLRLLKVELSPSDWARFRLFLLKEQAPMISVLDIPREGD